MNTLSASLKLRPTRIGFLVDPQDAATLRRIFQTCTCLGGGVFNPIIPVCKALPDAWRDRYRVLDPSPEDLAKGYIGFFEPDVFVEAGQALAGSIGISSEDRDFSHPRVLRRRNSSSMIWRSRVTASSSSATQTSSDHLDRRLSDTRKRPPQSGLVQVGF